MPPRPSSFRSTISSGLPTRPPRPASCRAPPRPTPTRRKAPSAKGVLVLFGRTAPGKTAERRLPLPTDPTLAAGDVAVALDFHELNDYAPAAVEGRFALRSAARPDLAFSARAIDDG